MPWRFPPVSVPERAHVPQRDAEVPDGDRRRERQPVRGAVRHPLHPDHVSAQAGETYTANTGLRLYRPRPGTLVDSVVVAAVLVFQLKCTGVRSPTPTAST